MHDYLNGDERWKRCAVQHLSASDAADGRLMSLEQAENLGVGLLEYKR